MSFIANPTHVDSFGPESRSALLSALAKTGSLGKWSSQKEGRDTLRAALGIKVVTTEEDSSAQTPLLSKEQALKAVSAGIDFSAETYAESIKTGRIFLKQLKIDPGQLAVVVNGRVSDCDPG